MDLIIENQKEGRTRLFGVQDFQVDNNEIVVFWPYEVERDETKLEGRVIAGVEETALDMETCYTIMRDCLASVQNIIIANRKNSMAMKAYNDIVEDIEKGNIEEEIENVTIIN